MSFAIETREGTIESLVLRDAEAKSMLVLAPARGGMASRLSLGGRHRFFLDESTLRDPTKNVRGGNPVLFPSPGKLENDTYARGSMKQHGFARNLPWEVASTQADGDARATLRLRSSDETRAMFPWDFVAEYTYILKGMTLRIEQRFTSSGGEARAFGAGFHPYFHVKQSEKPATRIVTKATRAFDNVTKKEITFEKVDGSAAGGTSRTAIDLGKREVDLHLLDHGAEPCTLESPTNKIVVRGSPEFTHFVVWTLEGKDFVCVEPWTCPGNALNTVDRLMTIEPGASKTIWVEYEAI